MLGSQILIPFLQNLDEVERKNCRFIVYAACERKCHFGTLLKSMDQLHCIVNNILRVGLIVIKDAVHVIRTIRTIIY